MFTTKLRGGYKDFSSTSSPRMRRPLHYQHPPLEWGIHLLQLVNLLWHIIFTQSPRFALGFTLDVHSMGLPKCIMSWCHPFLWHRTDSFHCPENSPALHLLILPCSSPQTLAATDLSSLSMVLFPFPECHLGRIIGKLFQIGVFHLVIGIKGSTMFFHSLIAPFFKF